MATAIVAAAAEWLAELARSLQSVHAVAACPVAAIHTSLHGDWVYFTISASQPLTHKPVPDISTAVQLQQLVHARRGTGHGHADVIVRPTSVSSRSASQCLHLRGTFNKFQD